MFGRLGGYFGGTFDARYRTYPVAFLDKLQAEEGDKVMLPPSALERLSQLHVEYPMLFKVENPQTGRSTHCGVLEFTAEEGIVYMPYWMMQNLCLNDGDVVSFTNVSLPKGTYVKLQPVTSDFLDICNPKAVLEKSLRSYTCLTIGDNIAINYNNRKYEIEVREAKPGPAISVVETDCEVDFEAPKDYKPPEPKPVEPVDDEMNTDEVEEEETKDENVMWAFSGTGARLDGKPLNSAAAPVKVDLSEGTGIRLPPPPEPETKASTSASSAPNGQKAGKVVFGGGNRLLEKLNKSKQGEAAPPPAKTKSKEEKKKDDTDDGEKSNFSAFSGKGFSLKG
ncbi:hypothetical protein BSKO_02201 [Bryopsis sp. KO-2023]|nr:hypothetical protein BSKO_02201 [Bryopsis sp. KO-2023]